MMITTDYTTQQLRDTLKASAERLEDRGVHLSTHELVDELALLAQQIILTGRHAGIHITFQALESHPS